MTEQTLETEQTDASRYVEYLLGVISEYSPIDPVSEKRAVDVIRAVSDEHTVYPSASTEPDGSLTLYWRGGNRGVELNVGPGDEYFYSVDGKYAAPRMVEGNGEVPLDDLRSEVSDFSRFVYSQNPSWKELFPSDS